MATRGPREKIAVLGGGIASLAAVYSLTSEPDWQERYEITLYQMGFRLGGKGASGRNRNHADRIEEHGIHVFFGFYDNAFRVMKEVYEELDRPLAAPLARVTDAWKPYPTITFTEKHESEWSVWPWEFAPNDARLGEGGPIPTPWGYVEELLASMLTWFDQVVAGTPADLSRLLTMRLAGADLGLIPALVNRLWRFGRPSALAAIKEVILALQQTAQEIADQPNRARREDRATLLRLIRRTRTVRDSARWLGSCLGHIPSLRRALVLLDFATTTILGLVEDEVVYPPEDWRKIDDVDLRKWLVGHGAAPETAHCALIDGMYAGIFSTEHEVGAGTMLQYTLRMLFTYRGAVLYKMQAGMGDTIFAPLYQVLARRGVRFEFFHRVDRLELGPTRGKIARVVIGRQIEIRGGAYEPLYDVKGLPCWPSEPLYEQLVQGEALRASGESLEDAWTRWPDALPQLVLEAGKDFDRVLLGISLGALPGLCAELVADPTNPRFRRMLDALRTVGTQAMQLWQIPNREGLGWPHGNSISIPYEEPFDTWTDMAHLIPRESWRPGEVGAIAYLCSPMPDVEPVPAAGDPSGVGFGRRQHERVVDNARGWIERYAGWLWPNAADRPGGDGLDWKTLVDREGRTGAARLLGQHFEAPTNLSDRYNLSLPGSVAARISANGSGYANLIVAGDWTLNPINAGCVEAATMSGLLAARAISGINVPIPGDWLSPLLAAESPSTGGQAARPLYVVRDLNETPAPPFVARGTKMTIFPVAAKRASLQALCDRHLQIGGPTLYRPLLPLALFYAQDNAAVEASEPSAAVRELDFGFLVPLLATEPDGSARIVAFTPYLWVDTELACRAGREIYGYPKGEATLVLPPEREGAYSVDGWVANAGRFEKRRLVEARPTEGKSHLFDLSAGLGPVGALAELVALFAAIGLGDAVWALAKGALDDLASGQVPMIFLKQFRDIAEPNRACYQAIVEAEAKKLGDFRAGGRLHGSYKLEVADAPSYPLASRLGLEGERTAGGSVVVPVRCPLWLEFDFVLGDGREVWRSGT
ncbi:MAG TPA: NAD(P)-binding protein [Thermoanaerobaculia bacterium]|nr:NAD(P)-binding protein [Thermoanaerobaculia bacterium]